MTRRPLVVFLLILLAVGVLYLLFTVVFPWVEQLMEDPTLGWGHTSRAAT